MTIANGQTPDADEVLRITKIDQVYTGSGFNTSSGESSVEMTAISSTDLVNANFAVVKFTITATSNTGGGSTGGVSQLKAQIKETGQSYADIISYKTMLQKIGTVGTNHITTMDYTLIATLTSDMRTNGFQIKLFGNIASGTASITNIQTTLEVKA